MAATLVPHKARQHDEPPEAPSMERGAWRDRFERVTVDVIRGHMVLGTIVSRQLPFFVIGVPFSIVAGMRGVIEGSGQWLQPFEIWLSATLAW